MMRYYLKEVNMYGTQTGIYPGISMAKKCCQRPGTKLSANPAPNRITFQAPWILGRC